MADVDLDINVKANVDPSLNKINKTLSKTQREAQKTEKDFAKMALAAGGVAVAMGAIGTALGAVVDQAIIMEDLTTQFIAFTGSADSAAEQLERIAEFSASTPFQLEDLANANRTLLAFGSSTEESLEQLNQLGEAAAATGADINDLARIFGQIQTEGKLTGERFNQLAERGINIGPALAESLGVAESRLKSLRAEGKISADAVAEAFERMTTGSGQFAGSMERLSQTLSGSLSTLKDNFSLVAAEVGAVLTPAIVGIVGELTNAAQVTKAFIEQLRGAEQSDLEKRIEAQKEELAELVDELDDARASGKGFFQSQEEYEAGLRSTEEAIKANVDQLKKLQAARRVDQENQDSPDKVEEKEQQVSDEVIAAQEKIDAELLELSKKAAANRQALAEAETDEEIVLLEERFAKINEKIVEQGAARLELAGQFDEAEKLQVEAKLASIDEVERANEEQRKKRAAKARKDEFNIAKINADATVKFEEQTWLQRAQTTQRGLAALASLQSSGSREAFEIGKAAAISQALVSIPATAIEAYKSLAGIPIVGPGLGAAAAAAAVVAGTSQINRIRSQSFQGMAEGGLVEGGIPGRDSVPILAQRGEVVVPEKNFADIESRFAEDRTLELVPYVKTTNFILNKHTAILEDIASSIGSIQSSAVDFEDQDFFNDQLTELDFNTRTNTTSSVRDEPLRQKSKVAGAIR